ncbi:hypothetical protein PYCCODRAFT_488893 [Trametes coccinea BRFM310]|uniref:Uncharacterized protein n=1 Tax=Trametes coccinea (strain BRFM310) TaxID=1353009 RepID=A0A1Y2IKE5_TRAC3|nr:hypothetical protein PYCCODRAFT_488893 [Trametes coccinea BRFM310]
MNEGPKPHLAGPPGLCENAVSVQPDWPRLQSSDGFAALLIPCLQSFVVSNQATLLSQSQVDPAPSIRLFKMCHNVSIRRWPIGQWRQLTFLLQVIDGKLHLLCQHFIPMSTRQQDCLRPNCLFSRNHAHPVGERRFPCFGNPTMLIRLDAGCRSPSCQRMMQQPQRNPIRIHESLCADCVMRGEGRGALKCS